MDRRPIKDDIEIRFSNMEDSFSFILTQHGKLPDLERCTAGIRLRAYFVYAVHE